ncbi:hypothetical protein JRG19_09905 [Pseudoclavibacter alba]|uniref:FtsK/SpoIIIE domain-containing protein n=1 Tax=Pseudoclavibacter albus TaxID=272241 RepID=UPI0019D2BEE0|nr:FtsK/SpoIIIE domain-containing protein [Pseudoclavibacter alba]MBN6778842.1 hypothetical protein [Pseudoclavibacter alba]
MPKVVMDLTRSGEDRSWNVDASQRLPHPKSWLSRFGLPLTLLAIGGWGVLSVLSHWAAVPLLVVALLLLIWLGVLDRRDRRRRLEWDAMVLGLLRAAGHGELRRELVRLEQWTSWWGGEPQRVKVLINPQNLDSKVGETAASLVSARVGTKFHVAKFDQRACRLTLEPAPPAPDVPKNQARAEKLISTLFPGTSSAQVELDEQSDVTAINVKYESSPRLTNSGYRNRLEKVVSSMLPGRWRALWDLEGDRVRFELRPKMPRMIRATAHLERGPLSHSEYKDYELVYATDEDGRPVSWSPSKQAHWLIIGGTGSGKTSTQHTAVAQLTRDSWRVWVLDGKRIEFIGFRDWPNVELIAQRVEDQVRLVHAAHDLMEQRYTAIEAGNAKVSDFEPLVIDIDEYATFKKRVERWYRTVKQKGDPTQPPVFDLIGDIARLGRTAKIHIVLGIQRPDVTFLDGEMRDNFGCRTSLGRLSPDGAKMMWDSTAIGVVRTPKGQGVGLDDNGEPVSILCHYTPDPGKVEADEHEDLAALQAMRPTDVQWPRKRFQQPEPDYDLDSEDLKEIPPRYDEYASAPIVEWLSDNPVEMPAPDEGAPTRAAEDVDDLPDDDMPESDELAGYDEQEPASASDLDPGVLVLVDESIEQWAVLTGTEFDLVDDECLVLELQDIESGEELMLSVPDDEQFTIRRPNDEE